MEMSLQAKAVRHEVIDLSGLHPVGRRPPLPAYLLQLWQRRHFIRADSRARVAGSTRQLVLGNAWLVLKPLLDASAYALIFGLVLRSDRGIDNFLGYLVVGVFMFQFTARCVTSGANAVVGGSSLIKNFLFPRAALPIGAILRETMSMVPVLVTMVVLIVAMPPHAVVTWRWLLFPLVFALQLVFNLGLAFIAARLVSHVRDLTHLISVLLRFWLYGSAVFYTFDRFVEYPAVVTVLELNPMFLVLDVSRALLLYGVTPPLDQWLLLSAWAAVALLVGFVFFWRGEESYGRA